MRNVTCPWSCDLWVTDQGQESRTLNPQNHTPLIPNMLKHITGARKTFFFATRQKEIWIYVHQNPIPLPAHVTYISSVWSCLCLEISCHVGSLHCLFQWCVKLQEDYKVFKYCFLLLQNLSWRTFSDLISKISICRPLLWTSQDPLMQDSFT